MKDTQHILSLVKKSVHETDPNATIILYGSYARGDYREDSDIDLLILLDLDKEKLTHPEKDRIAFPLYDIALDTETLISPKIYTKKGWANHMVTPYYENVNREGVVL